VCPKKDVDVVQVHETDVRQSEHDCLKRVSREREKFLETRGGKEGAREEHGRKLQKKIPYHNSEFWINGMEDCDRNWIQEREHLLRNKRRPGRRRGGIKRGNSEHGCKLQKKKFVPQFGFRINGMEDSDGNWIRGRRREGKEREQGRVHGQKPTKKKFVPQSGVLDRWYGGL
jgi:hypothetical protein